MAAGMNARRAMCPVMQAPGSRVTSDRPDSTSRPWPCPSLNSGSNLPSPVPRPLSPVACCSIPPVMASRPARKWMGVLVGVGVLACAHLAAQRPTDPAMLAPQAAPPLDYVPVPTAITLPAGVTTGPTASAAFDAAGHLVVLTRGPEAFFEFDQNGAFLRSYGGSLFTRA